MVLIDAVVGLFPVSMAGSPVKGACSGSTSQIGDPQLE